MSAPSSADNGGTPAIPRVSAKSPSIIACTISPNVARHAVGTGSSASGLRAGSMVWDMVNLGLVEFLVTGNADFLVIGPDRPAAVGPAFFMVAVGVGLVDLGSTAGGALVALRGAVRGGV